MPYHQTVFHVVKIAIMQNEEFINLCKKIAHRFRDYEPQLINGPSLKGMYNM